jgi:methionyl-tRNA synthetase
MIAKNCDGRLPEPGEPGEADRALLEAAGDLLERLRGAYRVQAFNKALEATWEVIGAANRYIDEQAPWTLRKSDPARMGAVLYTVAETVRRLAILSQPVMPGSMGRMLDQLGVPEDARDFAALAAPLAPGTRLPKPEGVFPRFIEPEEGTN